MPPHACVTCPSFSLRLMLYASLGGGHAFFSCHERGAGHLKTRARRRTTRSFRLLTRFATARWQAVRETTGSLETLTEDPLFAITVCRTFLLAEGRSLTTSTPVVLPLTLDCSAVVHACPDVHLRRFSARSTALLCCSALCARVRPQSVATCGCERRALPRGVLGRTGGSAQEGEEGAVRVLGALRRRKRTLQGEERKQARPSRLVTSLGQRSK